MTNLLLASISILSFALILHRPGIALALAIAGPIIGYFLDASLYALIPLTVALIFELAHFLKTYGIDRRISGPLMLTLAIYAFINTQAAGSISTSLHNIQIAKCHLSEASGQVFAKNCPTSSHE